MQVTNEFSKKQGFKEPYLHFLKEVGNLCSLPFVPEHSAKPEATISYVACSTHPTDTLFPFCLVFKVGSF